MAGARVVVVGSINVDMVVAAERLPGPGETVAGGTLTRSGGGKGANQAVAAARAGGDVALVGAVGDDDLGAGALAELAAEGIDVSAVARLGDGVPTGVALIVVDAAGDNQIAVASGANHALDPDAVRAAVARSGAHAVLTGFELPDAVVLAAAEAASAMDVPLIVNPAPARALPDGLAAHHPILTPNEHEATALTGEPDPDAAAHALAARTNAPVVVTLGARGALLHDGGQTTVLPAPPVEAVDTTGAGDVFSGVLTLALAEDAPLRDAVARAIDAAAASVTTRGARGDHSSGGASAA
ncbi:PfkB family carbohydrate kinase [Conexibacter woesei]|uniref:PfkB family carbohydrate kinase n=1 Tax=Conexibacter woesei TaxID=191495 RepID=UPI0004029D4D|nr:PfkB family carbohydrate kinase [Conexibacter woesei]